MFTEMEGLDKYLTTEPEDNFTPWCEEVTDNFTQEFFDKNEDWIKDGSGLCSKWMNKLFDRAQSEYWDDNIESPMTPKMAAKIIEGAFNIYLKTI